MRVLLIGLVTMAGIASVTPASAQGVYFGGPGVGVGVDVGPRPYYRDHDSRRYRSYDYDRPAYRTYGYSQRSYDRGCRTIIIRRDNGSVRKIRRCD